MDSLSQPEDEIEMLWTFIMALAWAGPPPSESVVMLQSGAALCAGTVIDEKGTVITAYHCVYGGKKLKAHREGEDPVRGEVIAQNPRLDLALLRVPSLAGGAFSEVSTVPPRRGDRVFAFGHPFAGKGIGHYMDGTLAFSVSDGLVSNVGDFALQTSAPVNPGNSGGPLLNEAGELVGVVSRKMKGDGVSFATRSDAVLKLIESTPHFPLFGGSIDLSVGDTIGPDASTVDAIAELHLRNRLLLRAQASAPLLFGSQRFQSRQFSYSDWGLAMGVRQPLFSDLFSVDLLFGLAHLQSHRSQLIVAEPDRIELIQTRSPLQSEARLGVALGTPGLSVLLWLNVLNDQPRALLQVAVDFPGTLWRF